MSVAAEMVEEMSLSKEDAAHIAAAIFQEIFDLTQRSSPRGPDSGPRSVALSHYAGASEASDADPPHAQREHHHHPAAGSSQAPGSSDSSSPSKAQRAAHAGSHSALDSLLPILPRRPSAERPADAHASEQHEAAHAAASSSSGPVQAFAGLASTVAGAGPIHSLSMWLAGSDNDSQAVEHQPVAVAPHAQEEPFSLQRSELAAEAPSLAQAQQQSETQHEQQQPHAAQQSMPATDANGIGQLTPETMSYGTPAGALSLQTCTSPRSPEPDPTGMEPTKLNSQALTDMLSSAAQTVDRRLPMQKLFEHLEVTCLMRITPCPSC